MRGSTIAWGLTLLAGGGLVVARATKPKPRFIGDLAWKGDEVVVPVERFQLPPPPFALPAGVGSLVILVRLADAEKLEGTVVAGTVAGTRLPLTPETSAALGPQVAARSVVAAVMRDGRALAL